MPDDVLHGIESFGKIVLKTLIIPTIQSQKWVRWKSILSDTTCEICRDLDGKIYRKHEVIRNPPPLHAHCHFLYSNDGLIFVTYDHYGTFYEIS